MLNQYPRRVSDAEVFDLSADLRAIEALETHKPNSQCVRCQNIFRPHIEQQFWCYGCIEERRRFGMKPKALPKPPLTELEEELLSFGIYLDTQQTARYREWAKKNPRGGMGEFGKRGG